MESETLNEIVTLRYDGEALWLIDQRHLPERYDEYECRTFEEVDFAIREMVVRGAPAIGVAAAYGAVLAGKSYHRLSLLQFLEKTNQAMDVLSVSRPTAVNLMWAVSRMRRCLESAESQNLQPAEMVRILEEEAERILKEDLQINKTMAVFGNDLIQPGAVILTHCNAGALATAGYGTALGVIREAHRSGKNIFVYADETRPRLQGAKLTAWELVREGIPSCLIPDSASATLIQSGKIDLILTGADRIARNGDTANKIGTLTLSVLAKFYQVPFYIVAPVSTIDFEIENGDDIVIEERDASEVTHIEGIRVAAHGMAVYNPAFDVTPGAHISGIVTEFGVVFPPFYENLLKLKKVIQEKKVVQN
jgi:methylthioribose-1-phosphate isomerase